MPRCVLVTGGAKRIGAAIVRHLAGRGDRVVVHCHASREAADALAEELAGEGGQVCVVQADLADAVAVRGLVPAAAAAAGAAIDGLVNNASLFAFDTPPIVDTALLERHMAVNLHAPVLLASALAGQPGVEDGAVVNLLDQKLGNPNPDFFSYTCSRYALAGATQMLAQALAPRVRVNAVSPGLTLPSLDQSDDEFAATGVDNLLRRPIGAEEIARAVAYLLDARGVTGENLFVDNGQRFVTRDRDVMFATRGTA